MAYNKLFALGFAVCIECMAYAQMGKAGKALPAFKQTPAFQVALQHAQAARLLALSKDPTFSALQLERAISTTATPVFRSSSKTPQEHLNELETFIQKNGYFPRSKVPEEWLLYYNTKNLVKRLGLDNLIAQRIQELKDTTPQKQKKKPLYNLKELETFIQTHGHFPNASVTEEAPLYMRIRRLEKRLSPQDPMVLRIQALRVQTRQRQIKLPQDWLDTLEHFIQENGRYPEVGISKPENQLFFEVEYLVTELAPDDPIALRIEQLRAQYAK